MALGWGIPVIIFVFFFGDTSAQDQRGKCLRELVTSGNRNVNNTLRLVDVCLYVCGWKCPHGADDLATVRAQGELFKGGIRPCSISLSPDNGTRRMRMRKPAPIHPIIRPFRTHWIRGKNRKYNECYVLDLAAN